MLYFKRKYNYINIYHRLLSEHTEFEYYEFFNECKRLCLSAQRVDHHNYANLDQVYLKEDEWILVLNKTLDYNADQINAFREDMKHKILKIKHDKMDSVIKYCRSEDYNLSFFLSEALYCFKVIYDAGKENKGAGTKNYITARFSRLYRTQNGVPNMTNVDLTTIYDDNDISIEMTRVTHADKIKEKEKLVDEIKEYVKKTNQYKLSCVKLMSYLGEIDPIYTEIKQLINEQRDTITKVKRDKITGRLQEDFNNQINMGMVNFLEKGSSLNDTNSKHLLRLLLNTDPRYYKMLTERKAEYVPHVRRLIRNLRERIFNEKFSILKGKESRNIENLKQELEKIFDKYANLENSDYFLLNACFKNAEVNADNELTIDNVLDKVTNKIVGLVNKVLLEDSDFSDDEKENEEKMMKNYETGQKVYEELSKAEEQVNRAISDSNAYLINQIVKEQNNNFKKKPEDRPEVDEETVAEIYNYYDKNEKVKAAKGQKMPDRGSLINPDFYDQHRQSKVSMTSRPSQDSKANIEKTMPANYNKGNNVFESDLNSNETDKKVKDVTDNSLKVNFGNDELGKEFTSFNPLFNDRKSLLSFNKSPNYETFVKNDANPSNNENRDSLKDSLPPVHVGYDHFDLIEKKSSKDVRDSINDLSKITEQPDITDYDKDSLHNDISEKYLLDGKRMTLDHKAKKRSVASKKSIDWTLPGSVEKQPPDLSKTQTSRDRLSTHKPSTTYSDIHKRKGTLKGSMDKLKDSNRMSSQSIDKKLSLVGSRSNSKLDNLIKQQLDKDNSREKRESKPLPIRGSEYLNQKKNSVMNQLGIRDHTDNTKKVTGSIGKDINEGRKSGLKGPEQTYDIKKPSNKVLIESDALLKTSDAKRLESIDKKDEADQFANLMSNDGERRGTQLHNSNIPDANLTLNSKTLSNSLISQGQDNANKKDSKFSGNSLLSNKTEEMPKYDSKINEIKKSILESQYSGVRETTDKILLRNLDSGNTDRSQYENPTKNTLPNSLGKSGITQSKIKQSLESIPEKSERDVTENKIPYGSSKLSEVKDSIAKAHLKNVDSTNLKSSNIEGIMKNTQPNSLAESERMKDYQKPVFSKKSKVDDIIENVPRKPSEVRDKRSTLRRDSEARDDFINLPRESITNNSVDKKSIKPQETHKSEVQQSNDINRSGVRETVRKTGLTNIEAIYGESLVKDMGPRPTHVNSLVEDDDFKRPSNIRLSKDDVKARSKIDSIKIERNRDSKLIKSSLVDKDEKIVDKNKESDIKVSDGSAIVETQQKMTLKNIESGGDKNDAIFGPKATILNSLVENLRRETQPSVKNDKNAKITNIESNFYDFKNNLDNHLENSDEKNVNDTTILKSGIKFSHQGDNSNSNKEIDSSKNNNQKSVDKLSNDNMKSSGQNEANKSKVDQLRSAKTKKGMHVSSHIGITEPGEKNIKNFFKNFWGAKDNNK